MTTRSEYATIIRTEAKMRRLSCPAPRRESVEISGGKYYTKLWSLNGVKETHALGGWFMPGQHDFESKKVAEYALKPTTENLLLAA